MAMISVEIDTIDKSMSVKIDGKTLADVDSFSTWIDRYDDDKLRVNITTCTMSDDESYHSHNHISLAEEGKLTRIEKKSEGRENPFEIKIDSNLNNINDKTRKTLQELLSQ